MLDLFVFTCFHCCPESTGISVFCVSEWHFIITSIFGQSVGMPGPWLFFHHLRSSWSLMDISVWWSSLYTAFTLTRGRRAVFVITKRRLLCINLSIHAHVTNTQSSCSPLVVGDVQMSVDGEESLLQKTDPLPLLLLRLLKNGFHLFHIAGRVRCHILQHFLVALSNLQLTVTVLWWKYHPSEKTNTVFL